MLCLLSASAGDSLTTSHTAPPSVTSESQMMRAVLTALSVWACMALLAAGAVHTDEEGVMHSNGQAEKFVLEQLKPVRTGTHDQVRAATTKPNCNVPIGAAACASSPVWCPDSQRRSSSTARRGPSVSIHRRARATVCTTSTARRSCRSRPGTTSRWRPRGRLGRSPTTSSARSRKAPVVMDVKVILTPPCIFH